MTDDQQSRGPEGLSEDPIVGRLVPDPSQPPPAVLVGLLGGSPRESYWRIYFSSGLERYAEFKEEDVLTSVKIPQEQSPFAGLEATRVWLRRHAQIEYTRTESRSVQAEFLSGELAAGFGGAVGGLGAAQWFADDEPMLRTTPGCLMVTYATMHYCMRSITCVVL